MSCGLAVASASKSLAQMNKSPDVGERLRTVRLSSDAERIGLNSSFSPRSANLPWPSNGWGFFRSRPDPDPNDRQFHGGFFGHVAFFGQPPKCEVAHTSLPIRLSNLPAHRPVARRQKSHRSSR